MWTTKETKRTYRGMEIIKYEGSKMKDSFRRRDPRTHQKDDTQVSESILNWELHQKLMEKKYGKRKIETEIRYKR